MLTNMVYGETQADMERFRDEAWEALRTQRDLVPGINVCWPFTDDLADQQELYEVWLASSPFAGFL